MLATLVETPTPQRRSTRRRYSFRWWELLQERACACGRHLKMADYEPPHSLMGEEGCWDTSCSCGRVLTLYDLAYTNRQPPRGPAPTLSQRESGLSEEDVLLLY